MIYVSFLIQPVHIKQFTAMGFYKV